MIIKEPKTIRSKEFSYVYSDLSVYFKRDKVGGNEEIYADAYEPIKYRDIWTYTETDIKIEPPESIQQSK